MKRLFITVIKIFLIVVVTSMVLFQIPELRYDFGPKTPIEIESIEQLDAIDIDRSTFALVRGTVNFDKAATFTTHGLTYTYFLLNGYGPTIVVRTYETIDESWDEVDAHLGRLKPYDGMPFSRTVRMGFRNNFEITIPEKAYFLSRDDVPKPSGWGVGATIFAVTLWCILFYFFFFWKRGFSSAKPQIESTTE